MRKSQNRPAETKTRQSAIDGDKLHSIKTARRSLALQAVECATPHKQNNGGRSCAEPKDHAQNKQWRARLVDAGAALKTLHMKE